MNDEKQIEHSGTKSGENKRAQQKKYLMNLCACTLQRQTGFFSSLQPEKNK